MKRSVKLFGFIILVALVAIAFLFYQQGFYKKWFSTKDKNKFVWGIDISHHQKNVDFDQLVKDNKPAFVILKSTEGKSYVDDAYLIRLHKFRELGIPVGGYHFFNYDVSGKLQAEHYIKTVGLRKGDLYPILDVEMKHSSTQSKQWIVKEIKAFCELVEAEYGVKPIIYCEYDYYRKYLKEEFSDYQYWISDFYREPRCKYVMWQYDTLKVAGIKGYIDNNKLADEVKLDRLILR
jgi:lysozyme